MATREPKALRVRAIRAWNGRIQGWAVERRYHFGWREKSFVSSHCPNAHSRAMTRAHHYARAVTHA